MKVLNKSNTLEKRYNFGIVCQDSFFWDGLRRLHGMWVLGLENGKFKKTYGKNLEKFELIFADIKEAFVKF